MTPPDQSDQDHSSKDAQPLHNDAHAPTHAHDHSDHERMHDRASPTSTHVHARSHPHRHGNVMHDHPHAEGRTHSHSHIRDQGRLVEDSDALTDHVDSGSVLVIRPCSGLSGDMLLAGLACMAGVSPEELSTLATSVNMPADSVKLEVKSVNTVNGWTCRVTLPEEHCHRTFADIRQLIEATSMTPRARLLALSTFTLLATAEGQIHGVAIEDVTFHEVGALDSILDICLASVLFDRLSPAVLMCGPLPLCDGTVRCNHGLLPAPAPAVLSLLPGVRVRGIPSDGETVTPTAIALLKGFGAVFGPWPAMAVSRTALVYGTRLLPGIPNGALFAIGQVTPPTHRQLSTSIG